MHSIDLKKVIHDVDNFKTMILEDIFYVHDCERAHADSVLASTSSCIACVSSMSHHNF